MALQFEGPVEGRSLPVNLNAQCDSEAAWDSKRPPVQTPIIMIRLIRVRTQLYNM